MSGFYKRRRGVVEHIESGTIDLLESGIHDYLSLKANLVIGNGYKLPAGVVSTSAPALHAHCKRVSERTIQRLLNHLEQIGWLKFSPWRTPGKRGSYMVVICRASVHDVSGNEYRVNGEKTTDWRHPVYEPVGEVPENCRGSVGEVSGNRELREFREVREEKRKKPAAKPARPADSRYQPFTDFAYREFEAKHGQKPSWQGKDWKALQNLLAGNKSLGLPELQTRWQSYLDSTEAFTVKQGGSLAFFCAHADSFITGPISERKGGANAKLTGEALERANLSQAGYIV